MLYNSITRDTVRAMREMLERSKREEIATIKVSFRYRGSLPAAILLQLPLLVLHYLVATTEAHTALSILGATTFVCGVLLWASAASKIQDLEGELELLRRMVDDG